MSIWKSIIVSAGLATVAALSVTAAPPPPQVPMIEQMIKTSVPSPAELRWAEFKGGTFERQADGLWVEKRVDGSQFDFMTIGQDETQLYLYDVERSVLITLNPKAKESRFSVRGKALQPLYPLLAVSGERRVKLHPEPPQSGRLSEADRAACETRGGTVERAGLLGYERCTLTYSDGGKVCTDSSQCEGQCRAYGGVAPEQPAEGVCQKTDNPFGCYAEIKDGIASFTLCVD